MNEIEKAIQDSIDDIKAHLWQTWADRIMMGCCPLCENDTEKCTCPRDDDGN